MIKSKIKHAYVYSYSTASNGASELADALGIRRIKHERSKFRPARWKTVINWGSSQLPNSFIGCVVLNRPGIVAEASNKLSFFRRMTDAPEAQRPRTVPWTQDIKKVEQWLAEGDVFARTSLTGHSGHGIIQLSRGDIIPKASLFTKYTRKSHEFRVHICQGEVIDVQRKIRDPDREPTDWKVRSHANGFIFVRGGFTAPEDVIKQSKMAFSVSGLDFGAVDVIFSQRDSRAYVLEINTAPGLEGQTVDHYAAAFRKLLS